MQIFYRVIYNSTINFLLRNINYAFKKILKKIKIPPSGVLKLKTDSGLLKLNTNQTSYITQLLFWHGYKSFEYSEIFEKLIKEINTFLDIGSNIGYYSLLAARSNPRIKVFAFEPAFGPKYFLQKNIDFNNLSLNITPVDLALSNSKGEIDFYQVENSKYQYLKYNLAGEGNTGTKVNTRNFKKIKVKSKTLDAFVAENNIKTVDLIKIDTEGTELDILNCGRQTISYYQPIVICETLFGFIEEDLEQFFRELNYSFYNHTDKGLLKVSNLSRSEDNGVRNCFFVPNSRLNLISSYIKN